ncbi:hypothetical protein KC345_g293 [Hortaea werneckii]|nr:hypothetical protein KC345_g293 [Hortaea werneckii]
MQTEAHRLSSNIPRRSASCSVLTDPACEHALRLVGFGKSFRRVVIWDTASASATVLNVSQGLVTDSGNALMKGSHKWDAALFGSREVGLIAAIGVQHIGDRQTEGCKRYVGQHGCQLLPAPLTPFPRCDGRDRYFCLCEEDATLHRRLNAARTTSPWPVSNPQFQEEA